MPDQPATLAAALAQLQGQLPRIVKKSTGQVGTRTYKYGDLGDIMDAPAEPSSTGWTGPDPCFTSLPRGRFDDE